MKTLLAATLLSVTLAGPALAVPYSYEFASGAVTGNYTTDSPVGFGAPTFGLIAMQSWHVVAPDGNVWDSSNQTQVIHDQANYGYGYYLDFGPTNPTLPGGLNVQIDGPTYATPTAQSGVYTWNIFGFGTGTGSWAQTSPVQSVPLPGMLWPTVIGMMGFVGLMAWRRQGASS